VQFNSPEAARAARDELHMQVIEVSGSDPATAAGQRRYVEVFLFLERPYKLKTCRTMIAGGIEAEGTKDADSSSKDQIIAECRTHMASPGNHQLLLSMLGVALSQDARLYLKTSDQGLKQLLSQQIGEFIVKGPKGCEYVTYAPTCNSSPFQSNDLAGARTGLIDLHGRKEIPPVPASPQVTDPPEIAGEAPLRLRTPSDWGTPDNCIGVSLHEGLFAAATDATSAAPNTNWTMASPDWESIVWPHRQPPPQVLLQTVIAATQNRQISEEIPGLRVCGLPVNCTELGVLTFFAKYDVVDRISGGSDAVQMFKELQQAVVQMTSREDAVVAEHTLNDQIMDGHRISLSHCTWGESGWTHLQTPLKSSFTDNNKNTLFWGQQQQQQHIPAHVGSNFSMFDGAGGTGGSGNAPAFIDWEAACKHKPPQAFPTQPFALQQAPDGRWDNNSGVIVSGQPCSHHCDALMASGERDMSLDSASHSQTERIFSKEEPVASLKAFHEFFQHRCPQLRIA